MIALAAIGLTGLAYLAWSAIGWFGVGMLGLLVLFVALRVELEGDRPVGTQTTPTLYADQFHAERAQNRAERAGRRAEVASFTASTGLFAYAGALLAISSFGLVFLGWGHSDPPALLYLFGSLIWDTFQKGRP
ncbi:hypothetical protein [Bosea sp. ANAM02]|uniref:hypothetical protein n=1 Tax=Bosea sp. ANAM02 TaxID=2020412 RepID=UPI0015664F9C|nr:hypothetical protein [Bosea sp. ANAM02]